MRKGINPVKLSPETNLTKYHKVIMPVYIPHLEGYFKESYDVFRLSITSLIETVHKRTNICVILNDCCVEVRDFVKDLMDTGAINELVFNKENVGKINSVLPLARGCWESLVTISDADVLFMSGWIENVERCFQADRFLGFCSPCPIPYAWDLHNNNTLLRGYIKGLLDIGNFLSRNEIMPFVESIRREEIYSERPHLIFNQVAYHAGEKMLLGAGHFVGTYHRTIFDYSPIKPSGFKLRGNSVGDYLDKPVEFSGLNRLATSRVYCHHIGNSIDDFIRLESLRPRVKSSEIGNDFVRGKDLISYMPYVLRYYLGRTIKMIIKNKFYV